MLGTPVPQSILQIQVTALKPNPYVGRMQLVRHYNLSLFPFLLQLLAWWRGIIVRNEIGGFKMPRKEKDDGKDSKGKGRGKDRQRSKR